MTSLMLYLGLTSTFLLSISLLAVPVLDALHELGYTSYRRRHASQKEEYLYYVKLFIFSTLCVVTSAIILLVFTDFQYLLAGNAYTPSVKVVTGISVVASWIMMVLTFPVFHYKKLEKVDK